MQRWLLWHRLLREPSNLSPAPLACGPRAVRCYSNLILRSPEMEEQDPVVIGWAQPAAVGHHVPESERDPKRDT